MVGGYPAKVVAFPFDVRFTFIPDSASMLLAFSECMAKLWSVLCFCVHDFIPMLPCFLLPCATNNFHAIHNTGDFRRSSVLKSLAANCANYLACIVHHQGIRSYYPWCEGTVVVRSVCLFVCYSTSHLSNICSSHERYGVLDGQRRSESLTGFLCKCSVTKLERFQHCTGDNGAALYWAETRMRILFDHVVESGHCISPR